MKKIAFLAITLVAIFLCGCRDEVASHSRPGVINPMLAEELKGWTCYGGGARGAVPIEHGHRICVRLPPEYRHLEREFAKCILEKGVSACLDDLAEGQIDDIWID